MSTGAKFAMAGSILFTSSMIYYVFSTQEAEQKRMKKGVKKYLEENKTKDSKDMKYTKINSNDQSSRTDSQ